MEIEEEDEMDDEIDSARSIRMEMVEVIKLKMSLDMPESKLSLFFPHATLNSFILELHPHKMDLILIGKVRPTKVPNPSTKKDGRQEVRCT